MLEKKDEEPVQNWDEVEKKATQIVHDIIGISGKGVYLLGGCLLLVGAGAGFRLTLDRGQKVRLRNIGLATKAFLYGTGVALAGVTALVYILSLSTGTSDIRSFGNKMRSIIPGFNTKFKSASQYVGLSKLGPKEVREAQGKLDTKDKNGD
eukprot:TRINITY_DN2806_c0_g1_i3.p1 TRINITY_DN2806_c0_g1~~TRINITY_DN2806_c0_g1_i3.p1  ORF type:complete len:151 (-),score=31.09 TRINITY_DN2806_c0_g1_i3:39-491(-)